jgi:hypothetical protein
MRRLLLAAGSQFGVTAIALLLVAGGALAYFTSTGSGSGGGAATSLSAPTISSATPGAGTVALNWSAVSAPGSGTVTYSVTRDGGTPAGDCAPSGAPTAATSCVDTGLAAGTHSYTVTAVWRTWSATSSPTSATVAFGAATHFSVSAATTTPNAGAADNLTITAKDASENTVSTYAGSHSLTFGGAGSVGGNSPTVTNASGSAIDFGSSTPISFSGGVASVSGSSNGVMKLYKAETASVTVSDGSISNGGGLTVTVGALAASKLSLAAATTTPTAGVADSLTITAQDTYGNTAPSYTGSHSLTFGGAGTIGANNPTVSNASGTATAFGSGTAITFTSGVASVSGANNGVMKLPKAETASITVTDGTLSNGSGLSVTVGAATAANLLLAAATTTPVAGAADNLTVTARDSLGNTATGYAGSKNLTFAGASNNGSFHPTVASDVGIATDFGTSTAITFAAGVATVSGANNGVMRLKKAETASITVTDGTISNGTGLSVTVSVGSLTSLSLAAATTTPNANAADNLTITAIDAGGNTVTSYTGSHSLTFGGAGTIGANTPTVSNASGAATAFGSATAITFTSGVATVAGANNGVMKLPKAETASITVTDGSVSNGSGLSVTVAPLAAGNLLLAAATTTPAPGAADNLTVTARDSLGNTATAYTGSKSLTFAGASVSGSHTPTVTNGSGTAINLGTATAITFTNGVASVSGSSNGVMTLYKAETKSITVTDGTLTNGTGVSVTVSVGPVAGFSLAAVDTTPNAGVADNLTITAQDAGANTVTSYAGSHSLTFGGAGTIGSNNPTVSNSSGTAVAFGSSTAITFTSGVSTVSGANNGVMKLPKAETASITATDGSVSTASGLSVTVAPLAISSLSLTAATTTPNAGENDNLTVTALDSFGNTATSYAGNKNLTFGGASALGGSNPTVTNRSGAATNFGTTTSITFTSGVATVSGTSNGAMNLKKAETASITVTNGTQTNGTGLSVTVSVGPAASLSLAAATTTPTAGAADSLTITALDAAGNTVTSYTGDKSLTFSGPNSAPSGTAPTVSDKSGSAVAFGTATTVTFTNGVASVSGAANGVLKLYKAETASLVVSDGSVSNGTGVSVTVSAGTRAGMVLTGITANPTPNMTCTGAVGSLACSSIGETDTNRTLTARVALADQYQNLVANTSGGTITVALASVGTGTGGTLSPASLSIANGQTTSSATFTLTRNAGSGSVTMTATSSGQTLTVLLST